MNSQTHLLVAATLFCRPDAPKINTAALLGAFVPDAAIYGLWFWSKFNGVPERKVWNELYWQQPWQTYTASGNSVFLYLIILMLGLTIFRTAQSVPAGLPPAGPAASDRPARIAAFSPVAIFALAALTHLAGDFPVHVDDAHAHFWPFSDWRFTSPVSYWNPDHYGGYFSAFEAILGIVLAIILFRRFHNWWVRVLCILAIVLYVAVPAYYILLFR